MSTWITSRIRGRTGIYTLTIERVNLGSGETSPSSISPNIETLGRLKYGESRIGYWPNPILPSWIEITFEDKSGGIRDVVSSTELEELDYPVTIIGPNFIWNGYIKRGLVGRPTGRRIHKGFTQIYLYDRLAFLKNVEGIPTEDIGVQGIIYNLMLQVNPNLNLLSSQDLYIGNGATSNKLALASHRYDGQLTGDGRGDYGTGWEQIVKICQSHGGFFYQNFRTGSWEFTHRGVMGTGEDFSESTRLLIDQSEPFKGFEFTGFTRTAYVENVPPSLQRGLRKDEFIGNPGLKSITIKDAGFVNFIVDPEFILYTGSPSSPDFDFWVETGSITKDVGFGTVGGIGSTSQVVGQFSPETDVWARLEFFKYNSGITSVIYLDGNSGTEYWLDSGGVWQTSFQEKTHGPALGTAVHAAIEDFPESGEVTVIITNSGASAHWGHVNFFLTDNLGVPITDWTFRVGTVGENLEIDAVPDLLIGNGSLAEVFSLQKGLIQYGSINEFIAQDRLGQDRPGLDNLKGAVRLVVGPETLLDVEKDNGLTVPMIANGAEIDFIRGETIGVWLETPEVVVGSGSAGSGSGS